MNKKVFFITCALLFIFAKLTAQQNEPVRYEGAGLGVYFCNSYPAGKWSEYVKASVGGGLTADYILPIDLGVIDLGINLKAEYAGLVPKATDIIISANDITFAPGVFCRIPFSLGKFNAAFVPVISYGIVVHSIKAKQESKVTGVYRDQTFCLSPALRFCIPNMQNLEVELAQISSFAFEDSNVVMQMGFHLGAIWYFKIKQ